MPDPSRQRRDLFHLGPYPVAAGNVHLLAALDSLRQQGGQQLDNRIVHLRPDAFHFMAALLRDVPEGGPAFRAPWVGRPVSFAHAFNPRKWTAQERPERWSSFPSARPECSCTEANSPGQWWAISIGQSLSKRTLEEKRFAPR